MICSCVRGCVVDWPCEEIRMLFQKGVPHSITGMANSDSRHVNSPLVNAAGYSTPKRVVM